MTNRQRILAVLLIVVLFSTPSLIGYISARTAHYRVIDVSTAQGVYRGGPGRFWFNSDRSLHVAGDNGVTRDIPDKDCREITFEQ